MNREFSSLSKNFYATINTADKRLRPSMSIFVLFQILRQHECFLAVITNEFLLVCVLHVVPLKGELTREEFLTIAHVALVKLFRHLNKNWFD